MNYRWLILAAGTLVLDEPRRGADRDRRDRARAARVLRAEPRPDRRRARGHDRGDDADAAAVGNRQRPDRRATRDRDRARRRGVRRSESRHARRLRRRSSLALAATGALRRLGQLRERTRGHALVRARRARARARDPPGGDPARRLRGSRRAAGASCRAAAFTPRSPRSRSTRSSGRSSPGLVLRERHVDEEIAEELGQPASRPAHVDPLLGERARARGPARDHGVRRPVPPRRARPVDGARRARARGRSGRRRDRARRRRPPLGSRRAAAFRSSSGSAARLRSPSPPLPCSCTRPLARPRSRARRRRRARHELERPLVRGRRRGRGTAAERRGDRLPADGARRRRNRRSRSRSRRSSPAASWRVAFLASAACSLAGAVLLRPLAELVAGLRA